MRLYYLGRPLQKINWKNDTGNGDFVAEMIGDDGSSHHIRIPVDDILEFSSLNPDYKWEDIIIYYLYEYTSLSFRQVTIH